MVIVFGGPLFRLINDCRDKFQQTTAFGMGIRGHFAL